MLFIVFFVADLSLVTSQDSNHYQDIQRIWPSIKIPNIIISEPDNETAMASIVSTDEPKLAHVGSTNGSSSSTQNSTRSQTSSKTVVFPSPICISVPMAPCIIVQIFWRNSTAKAFGLRIPINRLPSFPRPREQEMTYSGLMQT